MTVPWLALILTTLGVGLALLTRKVWRWLFGRDDALGAALHGEPDGFPFWEPEIGLIAQAPEDEADPITEELPEDPTQRMLRLMSSGEGYVTYGSTSVHQCCLADRREGRPVCAECAQAMAGVTS